MGIHKILLGDPVESGKWIPFARKLLNDLKRTKPIPYFTEERPLTNGGWVRVISNPSQDILIISAGDDVPLFLFLLSSRELLYDYNPAGPTPDPQVVTDQWGIWTYAPGTNKFSLVLAINDLRVTVRDQDLVSGNFVLAEPPRPTLTLGIGTFRKTIYTFNNPFVSPDDPVEQQLQRLELNNNPPAWTEVHRSPDTIHGAPQMRNWIFYPPGLGAVTNEHVAHFRNFVVDASVRTIEAALGDGETAWAGQSTFPGPSKTYDGPAVIAQRPPGWMTWKTVIVLGPRSGDPPFTHYYDIGTRYHPVITPSYCYYAYFSLFDGIVDEFRPATWRVRRIPSTTDNGLGLVYDENNRPVEDIYDTPLPGGIFGDSTNPDIPYFLLNDPTGSVVGFVRLAYSTGVATVYGAPEFDILDENDNVLLPGGYGNLDALWSFNPQTLLSPGYTRPLIERFILMVLPGRSWGIENGEVVDNNKYIVLCTSSSGSNKSGIFRYTRSTGFVKVWESDEATRLVPMAISKNRQWMIVRETIKAIPSTEQLPIYYAVRLDTSSWNDVTMRNAYAREIIKASYVQNPDFPPIDIDYVRTKSVLDAEPLTDGWSRTSETTWPSPTDPYLIYPGNP